MSLLDSFTDDELLEELVRRRNSEKNNRTPARWCEECLNFKTWDRKGEVPASYNPCSKGHKMDFHTPAAWQSLDCFGYYRTICADREECPQ